MSGLPELGGRAEPSEERVNPTEGAKARKDWPEAEVVDAEEEAGGTRKDWLESRKE